jgi:hypothetical protein
MRNVFFYVRFLVLTATSKRMAVFWDVALSSLVDIDASFRGGHCLRHHPGDGGSKFLLNIYQTKRCNITGDSHLRLLLSL